MKNLYKITTALLLVLGSYAQAAATYNDGPYTFIEQEQLKSVWLCNDKVDIEKTAIKDLPVTVSRCNLSATLDLPLAVEETYAFTGDYKIAAISDIHGQFDLMIKLLKNNGIINDSNQWSFGNGHLVLTGDVFDRGDSVNKILWFLYNLEAQAKAAGGQFHLLLGNHEVMVLNGNNKYVHKKYLETAKALNTEVSNLYGQSTVLGQWLRSKPVAIKINNKLFMHGGLSPAFLKANISLKQLNHIFTASLVEKEIGKTRNKTAKFLHGSRGPIWYRGYFKDSKKYPKAKTSQITKILKKFAADAIIVGHTSQKNVKSFHNGKVIAVDSSIKRGQYGELLLIDGEQMWRLNPDGEKLAL